MIPVTKPFLPAKEKYLEYIDGIWKRGWLTNMGPLSNDLEMRLKNHLDLKHLLFISNGFLVAFPNKARHWLMKDKNISW